MKKNLAHYLFGKTRAALLAAIYLRPEQGLHLRELARITGASPGTVHRELSALVDCDLLQRRTVGRQVFYSPNAAHPIQDELARLMRKTLGPVDVIRQALQPFSERIVAAFVYGSVAAGTETAYSDVDVMVLGEVGLREAVNALAPSQATLGREVNVTVMSLEMFLRKRNAGDGFTTTVWGAPKLWMFGNSDELG